MPRRVANEEAPTIFLVDAWASFRRSLRLYLEATGHRVSGEADTVDQAAATEELRDAHIVLLEPNPDWPELERDLATLRLVAPAAGVVLLGSKPLLPIVVREAVRTGARAYLTKDDDPNVLLLALHAAASTEFVTLPRHLLPETHSHLTLVSSRAAPLQRLTLTRREHEILTLAASSHSNRQIAAILWVTDQTVQFHLANTYRKLGVATRAAAVAAAKSLGLLA